MKKKLLALLAKKEARKAELGTKANTTEDIQELRSINTELDGLNGEIAELRSMIDSLPDDPEETPANPADYQNQEQRGQQPIGSVNVLGTYGVQQTQQQTQRSADRFDTPEYRSAFMDFALRGVKNEALEFRVDATAGIGDIGAIIPTSITNKIIEKMNSYGMIWNRVTKTSIKGGVELPVSAVKPTATWIAEGSMADKQKKTVSAKISFSYYKLQIRVAVTLEADTVSLPIFEQTLTENVNEAMLIALEKSIMSGSGVGQPLGIIKDTGIPAGQKIGVKVADAGKYATWINISSKIPLAYEGRVAMILTKVDWEKYIVGMVDNNGQPIARVNYGLDGRPQRRFLGYEVILVDDYLSTIDAAATDDVFGVICDLKDYIVNSNMQMTFKRYFDENTDEWISKSTLIADGKLGDKSGVLLLTKAAAV